jgi:two-component system phosphate regulon sensor histidine kinase PhoR
MWQLYLSYLLLVAVPICFTTLYASRHFKKFFTERTIEDLKSRSLLIGSQVQEHMAKSMTNDIDSLCKALARRVMTRFTVIAPSGKVIGDSEKDPDSMENHGDRPEVIGALSGEIGISDRFSATLKEPMVYVATPVYVRGAVAAAVRTAIPSMTLRAALNRFYGNIGLAALITALLAALVSYVVSRKINAPIAEMKAGAQRFAAGDFGYKVRLSGFQEMEQLAETLNDMARRLGSTIDMITEQKNRLDAVLSSMIEGVIAIDAQERVITLNRSAAALFGIDPKIAAGKLIGEALRNIEVQDFLHATLSSAIPVECELTLTAGSAKEDADHVLQLHGTALRDAHRASIGALMVVNDITRIKKLENIRKDFVANVSHELRTPLTSIKGFVETLASGAIDNKEEAVRFIGIIAGQVDRLNTIVEDLLSLSRIEREAERSGVELAFGSVQPVVAAAVDACRHEASKKNITISFSCDATVVANMEKTLLEQAIVNLIDNAVKYSEGNTSITVTGANNAAAGEVTISVADQGIGIPAEHLERIFERFYRVDKARSRKLGGTGLGLSIVKHIVSAHNGGVTVESIVGKGSTFTIHLPSAVS